MNRTYRSTRLIGLASLVLLTAACDEPFALVCNAAAYPSISVAVRDSVTGANVMPGSTLIQQGAGFIDSTTWPLAGGADERSRLSVSSALERAGVYTVTVRRSGYNTWSRANVRVTDGRCNVNTVELTARLAPQQ